MHLAAQEALLEHLLHEVLQLVQVERLDEVVVGARLERLHRGLDHRVAGHHDDFERRVVPLHLVEHLKAVHLGHPDVDQRGVEDLMADQVDRFAAARHQGDVVAPRAQRIAQELPNVGVIVDDQNSWAIHRRLPPCPPIAPGQELEHGPVPDLGLIAIAEVARRREHHQLRATNLSVHHLHRREGGVAVAADEQHGHPQARQLVGDVVHRQQGPK